MIRRYDFMRNPQAILGFLAVAALALTGVWGLKALQAKGRRQMVSGCSRPAICTPPRGAGSGALGVGASKEPNNPLPTPDPPVSNSQSAVRNPRLEWVLQAFIVNRLVRRPAPAGCDPSPFPDLVGRYAGLHGLDGRLVAALIEAESGFDPGALSEKGAIGLMQLLPSTAADLGVTDPWDPVQNVAAGVRYLRALLDRYGGDVQRALAAYNTGLDRVDRQAADAWPAETRQFVRRVLRAYDRLHKACP